MYHKVRNTLTGLTVALSMLCVSYGLGQPPKASVSDGTRLVASALQADNADATTTVRHKASLRRHLSMPYFSFGPLLPRQES
ncbi:hypothetical protein [Arenimonas sp.]|uniref:hypothetical protein n=1 Tax=Arenimonas sp. TaxID=1872635 RepID=UPI0039E2DEB1